MLLSRPDNPVTLPTFDDVEPIEDGLPIETGTLKVFNYQEYISPDVLAAFEDEFGVTVEVTTFISMDEAIAKLSSGDTQFDVYFPTRRRDRQGRGRQAAAAAQQELHPQRHATCWESLQDPFYDKGGVYSVPYTLFSTGIGYRVDAVVKTPDMFDNPYDIFWDPANTGEVYLLEDDREVFGMAMLRAWSDRRQHRGRRAHRHRVRRRERAERPRQSEARGRGLHGAAREAHLGSPGVVG